MPPVSILGLEAATHPDGACPDTCALAELASSGTLLLVKACKPHPLAGNLEVVGLTECLGWAGLYALAALLAKA